MQDLILLIRKLWNRTASATELNELLQRLDNDEEVLRQAWMNEMNNADAANIKSEPVFDKAGVRSIILSKIQSQQTAPVIPIDQKKRNTVRLIRVAVAAAVAVCILSIGYYYFSGKKQPADPIAAASSEEIIRAGKTARQVLLTDSSTVLLYEGSSLQYDTAYNVHERKLFLKGKARFTVKKDRTRPFIVYSRHLSTTALGTVFEVAENNDSTVVHLLEGSVKVQNYQDAPFHTVYLTPGERAVSRQRNEIAVRMATDSSSVAGRSVNKKGKEQISNKGLSFKQMPLEKVFGELQRRYKTAILFDKKDLSGIMFTGTFSEDESLASVLQVIGAINNLEVHSGEKGFIIKK